MNNLVMAFDCDGTLDISEVDPGPVPILALSRLLEFGVIVGICGNTAPLANYGMRSFLFFETMHQNKAISLQLTMDKFPNRALYVFVGNTYEDKEAAREAGWTFIQAGEFAISLPENYTGRFCLWLGKQLLRICKHGDLSWELSS